MYLEEPSIKLVPGLFAKFLELTFDRFDAHDGSMYKANCQKLRKIMIIFIQTTLQETYGYGNFSNI